ncbi:hypothetical protein D3C71_2206450 [compost metagenome]
MRSRLSAVASMRLTAGGDTHSMRAAPLSVPAIMMAWKTSICRRFSGTGEGKAVVIMALAR